MENLFLTLLGAVLGSIPAAFLWARNRFTSTGAPGIAFVVHPITFVVHPHMRPPQAKIQCKIPVDVTNQRPGSVRLAAAYFVFDKGGSLKPDPKWSSEHRTGRFPLPFFCAPTKMHDWRDVYLRPGEKTDIWIGLDPQHTDAHIEQAVAAKNLGRFYFQMTQWNYSGSPKTRWVRVKL
jgi:hypothetical protein